MSTSVVSLDPAATEVEISDALLHVMLADGRELAVPLVWFPRLRDATPALAPDRARRRHPLAGAGRRCFCPRLARSAELNRNRRLPRRWQRTTRSGASAMTRYDSGRKAEMPVQLEACVGGWRCAYPPL